MALPNGNILALDVGEKRIGLAIASPIARLPRPLMTIANDAAMIDQLTKVVAAESVACLVVGLPRNLSGVDTAQTDYVRQFVETLKQSMDLPINFQDEALTSKKAEAELKQYKHQRQNVDVDSLAATYILEDYLNEGKPA